MLVVKLWLGATRFQLIHNGYETKFKKEAKDEAKIDDICMFHLMTIECLKIIHSIHNELNYVALCRGICG